jgi:hypothetical protein
VNKSRPYLRLLPHLAWGDQWFLVRGIAHVGVDRVSGQSLYGRAGPFTSFVHHFWGLLQYEGKSQLLSLPVFSHSLC